MRDSEPSSSLVSTGAGVNFNVSKTNILAGNYNNRNNDIVTNRLFYILFVHTIQIIPPDTF